MCVRTAALWEFCTSPSVLLWTWTCFKKLSSVFKKYAYIAYIAPFFCGGMVYRHHEGFLKCQRKLRCTPNKIIPWAHKSNLISLQWQATDSWVILWQTWFPVSSSFRFPIVSGEFDSVTKNRWQFSDRVHENTVTVPLWVILLSLCSWACCGGWWSPFST